MIGLCVGPSARGVFRRIPLIRRWGAASAAWGPGVRLAVGGRIAVLRLRGTDRLVVAVVVGFASSRIAFLPF